jgi:ParB/RepB/Spo0J family partition protein
MEQKYNKELVLVDINDVEVHPLNDRPVDQQHVDELTEIIKEKGLDDGLPLFGVNENDKWLITAGKYRFLAAKQAGLTHVFIVDKTNQEPLEIALDIVTTNNSSPCDMLSIARNYLHIKKKFGLTQKEYSARIGKNESHISNCLKALEFSDSLGEEVSELSPYKMSAIGRAPEEDQLDIARKAIENDWNLDRISDEVAKRKQLKEYKDSDFEDAENKSEPTREMAFMVPLSLIDTVNDAITKVKQENTDDGIEVYSGFALGLLAGYYLGEINN